MKRIFTREEIEKTIQLSPKHIIEFKTNIDGSLDNEIEAIEIKMFWSKLSDLEKNENLLLSDIIKLLPTNDEINEQKYVGRSPANIEEWEGFQLGVNWLIDYIMSKCE